MFLQLILVSFLGLAGLYPLFSRTRTRHIFWIVYAALITLANLVFYNQKIGYKTRFSGDRWNLLQDLYVLILAEIFLLLMIGVIWRSGRAKTAEQHPFKPFPMANPYITIVTAGFFILLVVLLPYIYS
jgi:hypothetical protein